jgi:tRNA threonylcarbamoyladenosine biosynthesis protein TsaE
MKSLLNQAVFVLPDEESTIALAKKCALCLPESIIMTFSGDIGTGKTTFIRALLQTLGVQTAIKSPTFSLIESYSTKALQLHHFDLYRIVEASELEYLGFRDYFAEPALCFIEWPEHAKDALTGVDVAIRIELKGTGREMQIHALSVTGHAVIACLKGEKL